MPIGSEGEQQTCLVYVTASDREECIRLGREAVEKRLAACANVIAPTTAIFRWDDDIQEAEEATLILKTARSLVPQLTAELKEQHSYDLPCIVAVDIEGGLSAFTQWIAAETALA
jgi:periplasmic divalent cation tolerance protein